MKETAATAQMIRSPPDLPVLSNQIKAPARYVSRSLGCLHAWSRARCPHRSRDTPSTRPWGLVGGIHAANGPAIGKDTAPDSWLVVSLKSEEHVAACRLLVENHAYRPSRLVLARLPSRDPWRHGCRQGATRTYLQRVLRWWAGKGPAANAKSSRARCPHRSRDTPLTRPWGLGGGIHAANGPAIGQDTAPDSWLAVSLKSEERVAACRSLVETHAHRPSRLVLARPPSRDPWRHGCRHGATWMYLQRVPRWWAGKGLAATAQTIRSAPDLSVASNQMATPASCLSRSLSHLQVRSRAWRPQISVGPMW
ncbi:hypothetical protein FHR48_003346 [Xanthomonas arboricola]|nr:hypothetical protein [Xanthomonas cannabis]